MALWLDDILRPAHLLPSRNANLLFHDVDACAHFGHRMFHLNACVDLQEIEIQVLVDQKLHRPGVAVADGLAKLHGRFQHLLTFFLCQGWRRRLLDDFLITALYGTLTFIQMNNISVMVSQHLHLDMSRILNVLLHKNRPISEILLRLTGGPFQLLLQVLFSPDDMHTFAATTCCRFDQHRIRHLGGLLQNLLLASCETKSDRNAFLYGNVSGRNLIAHQTNHLRIWTNENQVVRSTRFSQLGILREEAVTRMDGIGT